MYAEVLVEYNNKAVDRYFTYLIPDNLQDKLRVGMKVIVPFNNKEINGFVVKIKNINDTSYDVKSILSIVDEFLVLDEELMDLGKYLQEKTLCSKIAAYQTMLPSSLKVKDQKQDYNKYNVYLVINASDEEIDSYKIKNKRSKKQLEIIDTIIKNKKVLRSFFGSNSHPQIKKLIDNGIIKEVKEQVYRINVGDKKTLLPSLTLDQENVVRSVDIDNYDTYLLYGVTGSGKTLIYMKLMMDVIKSGKKCIMLVPEISLTAQMTNRFYEVFGSRVAIFHSSLSLGEKYDEYLKIYRGEIDIVVGTRSAIFTPLKDIGLIVLDEEHSENFKQDSNPRYSAIDMALYRAKKHNCPVILGSATPTLESMARAKKGVYKLLSLPNRVGNSKLPLVKIVDMTNEMKKRNPIISEELDNLIKDRLSKQEQIILLLNRRGFSTIVTCQNCGYTYKCPHCDITLTYHKTSNNLRCHYCGYTVFKGDTCPSCKEKALSFLGLGTEKLEETLKKRYVNARVVRMDVDTTSNKGSHEKIINDFKEHKYDILLGTQMISKGLDFPLVSLVGVINADSSLNIPDFRSGERTFSLLQQVAGRAGRSDILGMVILQTFNPDNFYLNCVKENSYDKFYNYEMSFRKKLSYPPYYYLVSIMVTSREYEMASLEVNKVYNYLVKNVDKDTIVFKATTAPLFRVNNIYRFQIMIKYRFDDKLFDALKNLDSIYAINNKVNFECDINPARV